MMGLVVAAVLLTALLYSLESGGREPTENLTQLITSWETIPSSEAECEGLSGLDRFACYSGLAVTLADPGYCDEVAGGLRSECLAYYRTELSPGVCDDEADYDARISCLSDRGGKTGNATVCGMLPEDDLRRDKCFLEAALNVEDVGVCGRISDSDMRAYCTVAFTGDESACEGIEDGLRRMKCGECAGGACRLTAVEWNGTLRWW